MNKSKELKSRYNNILKSLDLFQQKYQQTNHDIKLLAVTKNQSIEKILELVELGQKDFAENYVNEAINKINNLKFLCEINWHYIGQIQSNKTKEIAQNFSWVHSVDRLKIAQRLSEQRPLNLGKLNILIQVNLQNDTSKAGIPPVEAIELAKNIYSLEKSNLVLRGFMCILKLKDESDSTFETQLQNFTSLFQLYSEFNNNSNNFKLDTLSMGMSNDYQAAIASGSTMIRIGTALFGMRNNNNG